MARNNFLAGDTLTRSAMNAPFFLQSGSIAGSVLSVRVGAGRVRFPHEPQTVYVPVTSQVQVANPQANTYYTIFVTNRGTFVVSGHQTYTPAASPASPETTGEPIGVVWINGTATTANILGPWNMPSGQLEPRGELAAAAALRQRFVTGGNRVPLGAMTGDLIGRSLAVANSAAAGTGPQIAAVTVGEPRNSFSVVHGTVTWSPSGALANVGYVPSGVLRVPFQLTVTRPLTGQTDFVTIDERHFLTAQRAGDAAGENTVCTTSFHYVASISGSDAPTAYVLTAELAAFGDAASASARVRSTTFTVEPGKANSIT